MHQDRIPPASRFVDSLFAGHATRCSCSKRRGLSLSLLPRLARQCIDWSVRYPVVRLDFGGGSFREPGRLHANLMEQLDTIERGTTVERRYDTAPERFRHLIRTLRRPLRRLRSNSNPAETSSPIPKATVSSGRQHRVRWDTTARLRWGRRNDSEHVRPLPAYSAHEGCSPNNRAFLQPPTFRRPGAANPAPRAPDRRRRRPHVHVCARIVEIAPSHLLQVEFEHVPPFVHEEEVVEDADAHRCLSL